MRVLDFRNTDNAPGVAEASKASSNGASSTVQQAFVAVRNAGKDDGNVKKLVVELNGALVLIQKASLENSSDSGQATPDLQSAIAIAQSAQASTATAARQGTFVRQFQLKVSIASAAVIVICAASLYVYGDHIYHRLWLRICRGQTVKKIG